MYSSRAWRSLVLVEEGRALQARRGVRDELFKGPLRPLLGVQQLSAWVQRPDWPPILAAYARCVRITRDQAVEHPLQPERLADAAEVALYEAYRESAVTPIASVTDFFAALVPMIPAISHFFDEVLVMAEDPGLRANRLALLQRIAGLARGVADFSKLEGF